jgi:hypothetical protein
LRFYVSQAADVTWYYSFMKTTTLPSKHSRSCAPYRLAFLLLPLALACFALSPQARATCQQDCLAIDNAVLGDDALLNNTGTDNTAIGFNALYSNITGYENTATGSYALNSNIYGNWNTATGYEALLGNTTGIVNTATGTDALKFNTSGYYNTATGGFALQTNTAGYGNTATGYNALYLNAHGVQNTADGWAALGASKGNFNTAVGSLALGNNHGNRNIAVGNEAGVYLTGGDQNIDIGNRGVASESKTIRIGEAREQTATFIAGIIGATVPNGVGVIVDSSGHLGTTTSSERFKEAIQPMDEASEAIFALKPMRFRYKHELDPNGIPQFGLVAEDVEKR